MSNENDSIRRTGTREWAEKTINCVNGCKHDCRYCYARWYAVDRYARMSMDEWKDMKVRDKDVRKGYKKYDGVVMFPSTHDITPEVTGPCLLVLEKLLNHGNEVLLVSKPHIEVIKEIVSRFAWATDQLRFRFTIGAVSDDVLGYWEPGAPKFMERRSALKIAHFAGFKTSISAEPLLDPADVKRLFDLLSPFVNWEFWIGKLNKAESRVKLDDGDRTMLDKLLAWQTDERVMEIYDTFKNESLIRWKDSYKEVIERSGK
jgi:DNA repair photolyase